MKHKNRIKLLAVLISVSVIFSSLTMGGVYSFAENENKSSSNATSEKSTKNATSKASTQENTSEDFQLPEEEDIEQITEPTTRWDPSLSKEEIQKMLEDQRWEFEASLEELEAKLKELAKESKATEEYINALDEKIGYLNEELTILDEQIMGYVEDIDAIEKEIEENQQAIDALQAEIEAIEARIEELNEMFRANYEAYCARMRAVYMSGNYGIIEALLTSESMVSLFTRFEMIRSISKSDSKLLSDIEEEIASITAEEAELNQKKAALGEMKEELLERKDSLQAKKDSLSAAQEQVAKKKVSLSQDRAESDSLFAELTAQNGMYTEYRNEDAKIKEAVEKEIADLINGIITPEDVTMGTTGERGDTTAPVNSFSDVYSRSDAVLNMTYPVPGHYRLSAGYPNYSNGKYHGGIDFPCPTGTKVVAAQSGVVISVKELNTSYGYYVMIYHGTDSKGRKIVTLYAHNSQILVSPGDTVAKGQPIAKSGSTGNSTGPHCHFEIRINNARSNPSNYLSK